MPDSLLDMNDMKPLFVDKSFHIITETEKSQRVWSGLEKKLSESACGMLLTVWLSELPDVGSLLFRFMYKAFRSQQSIELNFGDKDVLKCTEIFRKVNSSRQKVIQFVRFQKTKDGIFFAPISPDFNVISLVAEHFKERYADQQWIIYDTKRRYGLYYDLSDITEITFSENPVDEAGKLKSEQLDESEKIYRQMWKNYFRTMTIKERINPKLQSQHMPIRYWKYLTEMQ